MSGRAKRELEIGDETVIFQLEPDLNNDAFTKEGSLPTYLGAEVFRNRVPVWSGVLKWDVQPESRKPIAEQFADEELIRLLRERR